MNDYVEIYGGDGSEFASLNTSDLSEKLNKLLHVNNYVISVSESFTAGKISSSIIKVPGASEIFYEGIVAYSNDSKINRLHVKPTTLKQFGAVSAECCSEMLRGLSETKKCNAAISSTGIAGPLSDNSSKPIGLCYIGICLHNKKFIYKFNFIGTREEITNTAVNVALAAMIGLINKEKN